MAADYQPKTLSEEIIAHMMSRLSPKSLMRFKCVSKWWCALIISPNFAAKHLSVSNKHNNLFSSSTTIFFLHFVLKNINTEERDMLLLSLFNLCHEINDDDNDDNNLDCNLEDLIIPAICMGDKKVDTHISGHCDGILCIFNLRENVILCNPSIKEFKLLPESHLILSSQDDFSKAYVGFGYDLISKTYKVVRIISFCQDIGEGGYIFFNPPKAEVYTLGTNSWREIETHNMVTNNSIVWPGKLQYSPYFIFMYCKGMVYWIAFEKKKTWHIDGSGFIKQVILSFDMSDEVFHVISYPDGSGIEEIDFDYKMLTVWNNDTIALSVCRNRCYTSSYHIWVIEEDDVVGSNGGAAVNKEYSWTKCLTFEPVVDVGDIQLTMAFGRDSLDRFLLVAKKFKNQCVVIFYDVSTNKFMHLPLNSFFIRQALFYVNSIVSINGGNYLLEKGD